MSASYPSATRSFTTKIDGAGNTVLAAHINDLQDEVVAIENDLRTLPPARLTAQTFTGAQQFPAGTNALPSVAVNDTDVGLYSSGTNALDFATNGVKALGIDATQFIDSPTQPRCQVFHNTTQSLTSGVDTALLFNSEDHDTGGMHDTGANTSKITIPTGGDGLYLLNGAATLANAVNAFHLYWRKNGTTAISCNSCGAQVAGGASQGVSNSCLVVLAAADYVELMALQDSGGAVNAGSATRSASNQAFAVKLW